MTNQRTERPYTRHIYLTQSVGQELDEYVKRTFGQKRAHSIVIQLALEEYLDRQNGKVKK